MSQLAQTRTRVVQTAPANVSSNRDPYATATLPSNNPLLRGDKAVRQDPARLKVGDIAHINQQAQTAQWSRVQETVKSLEKGAEDARSALVAATTSFEGSFWRRCVAWIGGRFGLFAPPLQRAQVEVSQALKQLQEFSARSVTPFTEEISKLYQGRTFTRTKETPRALVLASIPTELKHLNHDFDRLKQGVQNLVKESGGFLRELTGLGVQRIVVSRKAEDGKVETLEFAFRREGKVNVFLNGQEQGSMWNGKAIDVVKKFAAGEAPSFVTKKYQDYTVKPPSSAVETGQAPAGPSQTHA